MDNIETIDKNPQSGLDIVSSQIAFSRAGLGFLEKRERLGDPHFDNGPMRNEKDILGDMATWDPVFDKGTVHGVILVTAGSECSPIRGSYSLIYPVLQRRRPARAKASLFVTYSATRLRTLQSWMVASVQVMASISDGGMASPSPLSSTSCYLLSAHTNSLLP
jgi:hypothetical protein